MTRSRSLRPGRPPWRRTRRWWARPPCAHGPAIPGDAAARLTMALRAAPAAARPAPAGGAPRIQERCPCATATGPRRNADTAATAADAVTQTPPAPLQEVAPVYPEAPCCRPHRLGGTGAGDRRRRRGACRPRAGRSIDACSTSALDAAWATRFIPARRNGVPVASTLRPVMVFDAAMPLQAALDR